MRIMLIEDHKMLAECLKTDLEAHGDMEVDILKDMNVLKSNLKNKCYDLLLIDINLDGLGKGTNGLDLAKKLINQYGIKVLILTGYNLDHYQQEAISMGAYGFVSKEESTKSLRDIIQTICKEGRKYYYQKKPPLEKLTQTELKVLRLYASGRSRKEVAKSCYMSTSSLGVILNRIYSKLAVRNYQEMVQKAREVGYIDPF